MEGHPLPVRCPFIYILFRTQPDAMKYPVMVMLILLCTGLFLLAAGCTTGDGKVPAPAPDLGDNSSGKPGTPAAPAGTEAMVAFVKEAVADARANGKSAALAEFSNRNGSFFRGELYIYAYDWNGTTIAHPVNPEKIGVNRLNETDAKGGLFIRELRDAARNGSGFAQYYYINPVHNNTVEKKLGYVMKVDDSWWLGSGIYVAPVTTPVPAGTIPPMAEGGKKMVTFTEADNSKTGTIAQKTRFAIELAENPTTGFMWNATLSPGLELQSSDFRGSPAAPGMVGVGGTRTWIIGAHDPGDQKFSASYRRSWEPVTGNETAYSIIINVVTV